MPKYICLKQQEQHLGDYSIVPLRYEDRFAIMKWRNEQLYHLRQAHPLTEEDQQNYFDNVVAKLFDNPRPDQILFSYLENGICIGYGGLVHINWIDQNAEISFIMDTRLESEHFAVHWSNYLNMLHDVAFDDLGLHKVYTYAFDLRPHLYTMLETNGFVREATLKGHCFFEGEYKDVVLHSIWNPKEDRKEMDLTIREASMDDSQLYFEWANDPVVRQMAFHTDPISWDSHCKWFESKLNSDKSHLTLCCLGNTPVGQVRFDEVNAREYEIDISIDCSYRSKGLGREMLVSAIDFVSKKYHINCFVSEVKVENIPSRKLFLAVGFVLEKEENQVDYFKLNL